ncbi:MAG: hypothetical protein HZB91_08740 [Elusimicrobia bacterium]|nr:hypothetical protein [Elusimicrobiota bacterium]
MAFKRKETTVEAVDLSTITPEDAQTRIIAGVKKYATNEANWSKADRNTPYLGHITGMGIESANLADITMSIERQFLTKKTKKVPVALKGSPSGGGSETEFTLEDGDLGKLRILEGQDSVMATPGLTIQKLMELGHLPTNASYLDGTASFATIVSVGAGHRLTDALRKTALRMEKSQPAEKTEARANLESLIKQARDFETLLGDPAALAASKQGDFQTDKNSLEALTHELSIVNEKLKGVTSSDDPSRSTSLRAEESQIRTRIRMMRQKLTVSEETARGAGVRKSVDTAKFQEVRALLAETIKLAVEALAQVPAGC